MIGPNTGLVDKLEKIFKDFGPMTRAEAQVIAGVDKYNSSIAVGRLHRTLKRKGKRIYVVDYVYDAEGGRRYPRARYAAGSEPDAKKPKPNKLENSRRYEQSRLTKFRNNNVFHLGKSRDRIREELKAA